MKPVGALQDLLLADRNPTSTRLRLIANPTSAFVYSPQRPGKRMSVQLPQVQADSAAQSWMNLDELRFLALSAGCTAAEFARAAEMLGSHPFRVARYLKRHSFVPSTFNIPLGGHFTVG